jgi:hypothetical protein
MSDPSLLTRALPAGSHYIFWRFLLSTATAEKPRYSDKADVYLSGYVDILRTALFAGPDEIKRIVSQER